MKKSWLGKVFVTFFTGSKTLKTLRSAMFLSCFHKFYFATFCKYFFVSRYMQLLSIFAQNVKTWFEKYALKIQYFSIILVFSLNCIRTSFVRDWLRLNIIYDAAVGLRYGSSATTLDVLVPHSVRTMAVEPLQKKSVSNSGSGTFKAPTMLFKIVA